MRLSDAGLRRSRGSGVRDDQRGAQRYGTRSEVHRDNAQTDRESPAVALALASDFTRPLFRIVSSPLPLVMPVAAAFASVPAPARPMFGVGIVISNSEMPMLTVF